LPVQKAQIIHGVLQKFLGLELGGAGQGYPHQRSRLRANTVRKSGTTGSTPATVPFSNIEGQLLDGHVHRISTAFDSDDDSPGPVAAVVESAGKLVSEVISVVYPPILADPNLGVVHELGDDRAVKLAPLVLEPPRHDLEELLAAIEKHAEKRTDADHAESENCWRFGRVRKYGDAP